MKHCLLLVILLVIAAPVAAQDINYNFDEKVFQETYEKLLCQGSPEEIQQALEYYNQYPPTDGYQNADRSILQQCLPRRQRGEKFDLSKALRDRLRADLKTGGKPCPDGRRPVLIDSKTHDEWDKQLKSSGSFDREFRGNLVGRLSFAQQLPICGTVWKPTGQ